MSHAVALSLNILKSQNGANGLNQLESGECSHVLREMIQLFATLQYGLGLEAIKLTS